MATTAAARLRAVVLTVLFADLTAVGARLSIPLPPVPLTLQVPAALLAGAVLGARRGALSQALYLAMGLAGLPVFVGGGGPAYVLSPTFGYLLGFVGGAAVTGLVLGDAPRPGALRMTVAMLAGLGVVYLAGVAWLHYNLRWVQGTDVVPLRILTAGVLVPLPWDLLKLVVAVPAGMAIRAALLEAGAPGGPMREE